jgi:hypothetical protein
MQFVLCESKKKYNAYECQICVRQSGSQSESLRIIWFLPVSTIPPVLGNHLPLNINLI